MNEEIVSRIGFSLDLLAGFCAVEEAGSIVGASRGDAARQSVLSRQIRELEEFFGVELVRRQGLGLVLTDAGRELSALGRIQLTSLSDFAASRRDARFRVTLAPPESLIQWLILPRLAKLHTTCLRADFAACHEENASVAPVARKASVISNSCAANRSAATRACAVPKMPGLQRPAVSSNPRS